MYISHNLSEESDTSIITWVDAHAQSDHTPFLTLTVFSEVFSQTNVCYSSSVSSVSGECPIVKLETKILKELIRSQQIKPLTHTHTHIAGLTERESSWSLRASLIGSFNRDQFSGVTRSPEGNCNK